LSLICSVPLQLSWTAESRLLTRESLFTARAEKWLTYSFTEKDWNEYSAKVCEEKGREAPGGDKYRGEYLPDLCSLIEVSLTKLASKTLAEQAFWKFIKDEKTSFDGVTINPPLVFGPIIHQVSSVESLNTSVGKLLAWF
jgi:hypothetical protein